MANLYNLKKFDLNLLVIFECIYQHLSISKAAETLFITPSAVSQSLQRLRAQMNDPLFIRAGKGMTPTTMCVNLHHHLEKNLNHLEKTINLSHHSGLEQRFVIYSPQLLVSPKIIHLLNRLYHTPYLHIEHRSLISSDNSVEELMAYSKADLIFSLTPTENRAIICRPYQQLEMVLVCSQNHPRADALNTTEAMSEENFTYYLSPEQGIKEFQRQQENRFPDLKYSFSSDSYITILNIIQKTDLLGFIPKIILENTAFNLPLKILSLPDELPSITMYMIYNRNKIDCPVFAKFINNYAMSDEQ